jgi:Flp pilus assembly protein TadG
MQLRKACLRNGRRANVSVEFALISVLFLLPLVTGAADLICVVNARAQLNTALQAMMFYAWSNPTAAQNNTASTTTAAEATIIDAINSAPSNFHVTLNLGAVPGSYSNLTYYCVTPGTPYSITPSGSATCASGTLQVFAQFTVSTNVNLPFPIPLKLVNPFPVSSTGSAQIK